MVSLAPPLLALLFVAYLLGALAALGIGGAVGRGLVAGCALAGALAGMGLGLVSLGAGSAPTFAASFLPLTGLTLRVDGLSAFFLIVIGVVGGAVAVYGFSFSAAYEGRYGLSVVALEGFAATDSYMIGKLGPEMARDAFARIDRPEIEAFVVPGGNFPTMASIEAWEKEFGKPIVTTNQAALWGMRTRLGSSDRMPGLGQLLA